MFSLPCFDWCNMEKNLLLKFLEDFVKTWNKWLNGRTSGEVWFSINNKLISS